MAKTPDHVEFTVGVRGPSGEWAEIGTVTVPVVVVRSRPATVPLVDVPESAVFDPPAKRCADCGRLLRPGVDSVASSERGLVHADCPVERMAAQIQAAKRIGQAHLGRAWADVLQDVLRALDGEPPATNDPVTRKD